MSTTSQNGGAGRKGDGYVWPVDTSGSFDINAGDLVWFDASAHVIKPLDSDAHWGTAGAGYAYDASFINLYGQKKYDPGVVAVCSGVARLFTTAGDTYHSGDSVYYSGVNAQTITNTVGGNSHPVGVVYLPFGNTVTGATGTLIEVIVLPTWPGTGVA